MGELYARRAPEDEDERINWAIDGHANVVAELAAALNISRHRAASRLELAIDLRTRLPQVGLVFAAGDIDYRMVIALVNRSSNVEDDELLAHLDTAFATHAPRWMKLSGPKLDERIDMWVEKFDPTGVREPQPARDDRYVHVAPMGAGMVGVWARLTFDEGVCFDTRVDEVAATVCRDDPRPPEQRRVDAMMAMVCFDTRVDEVAATVCRDDPRPPEQRRVDAMMAMTQGQMRLQCGCGAHDCPNSAAVAASTQVVINVIAEQATIEGRSSNPGYLPGVGAIPAALLRERLAVIAEQATIEGRSSNPGYLPGVGAIPAALLRERLATAKLVPVALPEPCAQAGYRPSAGLARFIRCRDLACRFPGCEVPAARCQIDHTIAYPIGPTHPSNLKLLCVFHHLLKTFWTGPDGWRDFQLPDG
ncbi:HNH endonuclease signature motif containing protein, partial [Mycolicibacterium flavescens]|uniref:HNH endonuclease signature motif containing protein n=1 Tax=Mycolicibacterium flavescens TaxID=1776 RepID=UPI0035586C42